MNNNFALEPQRSGLTFLKKLRRNKKYLLTGGVFLLLFLGGAAITEVNPVAFLKNLPRAAEIIGWMFPPDWNAFPDMIDPALDTVQIAFLGTFFGAILSFFLGLGAAINLVPRAVREVARGLIIAERALPDLVVVLLFVAAVGLGPFPGVMALAVSSIGMLGKLFAEAVEEVDPRPLEALESIGATKWQVIRYGILPQTLPSFIANVFYRFDINIRFAVLLGAVGAGGIGNELMMSMGLLDYDRAMTAIIVTFILVLLCLKTSDALRKKIIGQEILK